MKNIRLIYASRFASRTGTKEIQDILDNSRKNNPEHGITGILCYAPDIFLQCLEGPRDAVNHLYCNIASDDRHRDSTILAYVDGVDRRFGEWSMAYVKAEDLDEIIEQQMGIGRKLDPYAMSAEQALDFVTAISNRRKLFRSEVSAV